MPRYQAVRQKGKNWYFRIQYKNQRHEYGPYDTAEAAHTARLQHLHRLKTKHLVQHNMTVCEFFETFMREHESINVRRSTADNTLSLTKKHILPALGNKKLADLRTHHIIEYQNMIVRTRSQQTAHNIMRTLRKILNKAVEWEYLDRSPLKGRIPGALRPEYPVLTLDQLFALVDKLKGRERCIVALAGFAALRNSEIFGLKWEDIDFKANTIHIRRQFTHGREEQVKTERSDAIIPIWENLARMLKEWKLQSGSHTWLFMGRHGKPISGERWANTHWKKIRQACGLPERLRFHDLRHTFASVMLAGGVSPGDVQKLLRHSSFTTTMNIYRHMLPGQLENSFRVFNREYGEKYGDERK